MTAAQTRFNEAYAHHSAGRRDAAIPFYLEVLQLSPDHLDATFMLGTLYAEQGDLAQAAQYLSRAAEINPASARVQNNLGNVYLLNGNRALARTHLAAALKLEPRLAEAAYNLSSIAQEEQGPEVAIGYLRQALAANPGFSRAHQRLAELLERTGRDGEAVSHFQQAVRLEPGNPGLQVSAGNALARIGKDKQAAECFARALKLDPGNASAQFALSALRGATPKTAPGGHVASLFDGMADSFDAHLDSLGYGIPALLRDAVLQLHDVPEVFRLGIDLGCGTGLSGEVFQTRVQRMIGVDLSEKMLACAREKNIYSELVHADGSAFLDQMAESADLFVAADIFVYVGALEALFGLIRSRSLPGALFAFSTEKASGNGYVLQKSGRFAHSPDYIAELAAANGFAVRTCSDVRGRMERGAWVSSQIFVLQLV